MPRIQVLLDESGDVVGTAEESQQATGDGAPAARLVPRNGQTVTEVNVSDAEAHLDATELLKTLQTKKLS